MSRHRYAQVDVFTAVPLRGNALAVVFDAEGLDDERMQALARWTNLSETTFLLPPTDPAADYRLRIFTPNGELPFAGHPTLGSCHAWLEAGGRPRAQEIVQEFAHELGKPTLGGFPVGHGDVHLAVPLGTRVRIDGDTLRFEEGIS